MIVGSIKTSSFAEKDNIVSLIKLVIPILPFSSSSSVVLVVSSSSSVSNIYATRGALLFASIFGTSCSTTSSKPSASGPSIVGINVGDSFVNAYSSNGSSEFGLTYPVLPKTSVVEVPFLIIVSLTTSEFASAESIPICKLPSATTFAGKCKTPINSSLPVASIGTVSSVTGPSSLSASSCTISMLVPR